MRVSCRPDGRDAVLGGLLRLAAIAVGAVVVSGCSATRHGQDYQSQAGVPGRAVAAAMPPAAVRPKVVIEADGLPSQPPPRFRPRSQADDPREPFSPNYGPPPPGIEPLQPARPATPQEAPVRKARMSEEEAEVLIGKAIAAHEVRRP
mgnify:CR=1 FL=1